MGMAKGRNSKHRGRQMKYMHLGVKHIVEWLLISFGSRKQHQVLTSEVHRSDHDREKSQIYMLTFNQLALKYLDLDFLSG